MAKRNRVPTPLTDLTTGVRGLVVIRESAAYGYLLLEGLVGQTLRGIAADLPGVADVAKEGAGPARLQSRFELIDLSRDGTRVVVFDHCGVYYLYSLGSAATQIGEREENTFIEVLCELLAALKPQVLYVSTFSRLIRSTRFGGQLESACAKYVGEIRTGNATIDLNTDAGRIMWTTLTMVSSMERDVIAQRLFGGLINQYMRGEYVGGSHSTPPGYMLDDEHRLALDTPFVPAVKELLRMIADPELTCREIVDAAGKNGLTSPTIQRHHGPNATYADIRRADSKIASIIDWIPAYRTGCLTMTYAVPYRGLDDFGGLPVLTDQHGEPYVELEFPLEVPEGGWAEPEILTAASQRALGTKAKRSQPSRGPKKRKPLVGWAQWEQDGWEFRVGSQQDRYRIMRQSATEAPK